MSAVRPRLWESDHPYYCSEGNYYSNASETLTRFDSWPDFITEGFYDSDPDLNLVFRWDWERRQPTCPRCLGSGWQAEGVECKRCGGLGEIEDVAPADYLLLFWVMQRKALLTSTEIRVRPEDEPSIRAWLTERARTIAAIWEPISLLP